ncbi:hypothetical protein P170DRAFT_441653 [Aspergillus steynii IBT 23096]|uniref:Uncharacterized protein n=1 Tax=Aspergillus steynii IBT 23096 TaxID=1392250 RepID=A0A2I2FRD5_9EURO|nr:uncharacterized protein P170DRAFT_441653 [Aspergillus steynii IBT 23096]PLB43193.1 hypothetical protein P170DRAFT_441653 [Aspergillus steynii IBT 23096]
MMSCISGPAHFVQSALRNPHCHLPLVQIGKLRADFPSKAGWPNGKALDYESRDCRFDPCVGQYFLLFVFCLLVGLGDIFICFFAGGWGRCGMVR